MPPKESTDEEIRRDIAELTQEMQETGGLTPDGAMSMRALVAAVSGITGVASLRGELLEALGRPQPASPPSVSQHATGPAVDLSPAPASLLSEIQEILPSAPAFWREVLGEWAGTEPNLRPADPYAYDTAAAMSLNTMTAAQHRADAQRRQSELMQSSLNPGYGIGTGRRPYRNDGGYEMKDFMYRALKEPSVLGPYIKAIARRIAESYIHDRLNSDTMNAIKAEICAVLRHLEMEETLPRCPHGNGYWDVQRFVNINKVGSILRVDLQPLLEHIWPDEDWRDREMQSQVAFEPPKPANSVPADYGRKVETP